MAMTRTIALTALAISVRAAAVAMPTAVQPATAKQVRSLAQPDDIVLSFNTFTDTACGNFYKTHNPQTAGICHQLEANELGYDVYFESGSCQREYIQSRIIDWKCLRLTCLVYLYSDADCTRGAAYTPTFYQCYPAAPGYNSYQVLC